MKSTKLDKDLEDYNGTKITHLAKLNVEFTMFSSELEVLKALGKHCNWNIPETVKSVLRHGLAHEVSHYLKDNPEECRRLLAVLGYARSAPQAADKGVKQVRKRRKG